MRPDQTDSHTGVIPKERKALNDKAVAKTEQGIILSDNNTRQGYVLRNTLKLAGYLFLALEKPTITKG